MTFSTDFFHHLAAVPILVFCVWEQFDQVHRIEHQRLIFVFVVELVEVVEPQPPLGLGSNLGSNLGPNLGPKLGLARGLVL